MDDDTASVASSSTQTAPTQMYRITLGATACSYSDSGKDLHLMHSFTTIGVADLRRMKRALYYFDLALFRDGRHRHHMLTKAYDESSVTGRMHKTMADAYTAFSSVVNALDHNAKIFIISATTTNEVSIIGTMQPLIYRLHTAPSPIAYGLKHCTECLKVFEKETDDVEKSFVCRSCCKTQS